MTLYCKLCGTTIKSKFWIKKFPDYAYCPKCKTCVCLTEKSSGINNKVEKKPVETTVVKMGMYN